ncbi:von Willebrand factor A domain-containing protein 8 [Leucoagaricus sp. SymC.cos]|nr:von Willebrand factor A domain-containing protein 8 [Leucoagaricus sp. SymC.cos]
MFIISLHQFNPSPRVEGDNIIYPPPSSSGEQTYPTIIPSFKPSEDLAGVSSHVPHHFYDNSLQTGLMRDLAIDLELLGEHVVLLGNQGVGKNKIVDRLCQLSEEPAEHIFAAQGHLLPFDNSPNMPTLALAMCDMLPHDAPQHPSPIHRIADSAAPPFSVPVHGPPLEATAHPLPAPKPAPLPWPAQSSKCSPPPSSIKHSYADTVHNVMSLHPSPIHRMADSAAPPFFVPVHGPPLEATAHPLPAPKPAPPPWPARSSKCPPPPSSIKHSYADTVHNVMSLVNLAKMVPDLLSEHIIAIYQASVPPAASKWKIKSTIPGLSQ